MDPLLPRQRAALLAWVERVLCGYFTHAGYLNWDTGASFRRWHQATKFGLAQGALLGIACAPSLQPAPEHGRWARYLFDRGLALFDRWSGGGEELPPPVLFGVTRTPGGLSEARLSAARIQANAARAATLGLAALPSEAPPPLYAYDPDVGRLAVSTPAYSTAVTVVDYERLPYGGAELARLFDGEMRVAAGIGGRPPASFGVVARSHATGREVGEPARTAAREPGAPAAAAARGAARRRGAAGGLPGAAVRRGVPDARGGGGHARRCAHDHHPAPLPRRSRRDALDDRPAAGGARALERRRAVPVDGRRRVRHRRAGRRRSASGSASAGSAMSAGSTWRARSPATSSCRSGAPRRGCG